MSVNTCGSFEDIITVKVRCHCVCAFPGDRGSPPDGSQFPTSGDSHLLRPVSVHVSHYLRSSSKNEADNLPFFHSVQVKLFSKNLEENICAFYVSEEVRKDKMDHPCTSR